MDLELLQERARIIRQIRSFFDAKDYLELDTPLMSPDLIPESCLEVFEANRILPDGTSKPLWLIPSPEIWMKKLIAQHGVNMYQICKCFRNGESTGFLHSPEFTMLEYYTMDSGYRESLALTEELFAFLLHSGECAPFTRITVAEAFSRYAGFDLFTAAEKPGALEAEARRLGLEQPLNGKAHGTAVLYDLIFIHTIEPQLKKDKPVVLIDYPAFVPCLAQQNPDGKTVQRWELYWNGIELANCYSEETNAEKVRDFFNSEAASKKEHSLVKHKVDPLYWKYFLQGETGNKNKPFPRCSGVALGLDRLIMALCGKSSIDSVLPFPPSKK